MTSIVRLFDIPLEGLQRESLTLDTVLSDPGALRAEFVSAMDELEQEHGLQGGMPSYAAMDELQLSEAKRPDGKVKMTVQVWRRGFELPQYASSSDLVGWCFLHCTEPRHEDSGSVALLDPRAGSEGTSMPGLPWGREVTFRPSPGLLAGGAGGGPRRGGGARGGGRRGLVRAVPGGLVRGLRGAPVR
ncbi:hypothetical protein [Streptomyces chartreusis]|uniref:hypothetical protein n=1 Tax=Streptomyces chartreusis TaxID=1969 RepID=UPI0036AD83E9